MSIDCMIVNLDSHQFLRPADMGLNSEIRSIENAPGLFHVAMARLLAGEWRGCRVAIIHDAGGPHMAALNLPSWDTVISRAYGWRNVLPDVVASLIEGHRSSLDALYHGSKDQLREVLAQHVENLKVDLLDEQDDDAAFGGDNSVMIAGLTRELEHAKTVLSTLDAAAKREGS